MALQFFNRQGDCYYIKSKLTKKGNKTYFMTKKEDENCLEILPIGYEVFEKPDTSIMFIRQRKENIFKNTEIQLIEKELKKNEAIIDFKLDIIGSEIKIYIAEKEGNERLFQLWEKPFYSEEKINDLRKKFMRFEEKMRISKKVRKETNGYEFQRYCYRGSINDWISIDGGENLATLAKENIHHLGRESYYDLI